MAAGPAGGGTEQAFELARNFTSYPGLSVARGACGQTCLCGAGVFFRCTPLVFRNLSSTLAPLFAPFIPRYTAAPGCMKAGVPKNDKAQYSPQAFRFFQDSSHHPNSEPDRGSEALL